MRTRRVFSAFLLLLSLAAACSAQNYEALIKNAFARSTLDQKGTKPFHLKAELAPSRADRGTDRTGEVEIWWSSPTKWRREVRSPDFHQISVRNGDREWQKNDGEYFPEWLRVIAIELIQPVPKLDQILQQIKGADVKSLAGATYFQWTNLSTDGQVQGGIGGGISVNNHTGLLFTINGVDFDGWFRDYQDFRDRIVARTVSSGSPEVTAKVVVLEDLGKVSSDFFNAEKSGGDVPLLRTVTVDELTLRKNLISTPGMEWPPVTSGPHVGAAAATICIDRTGKVRQVGPVISSNPAIVDVARKVFEGMVFQPYLENGVPVQVVAQMTLAFHAK